MDRDGRYEHIEDVLVNLHSGQWFGWSDSKNKIYANLIIHDDSKDKPTEKELTDALAKQQSDFDANAHGRKRAISYPEIKEQLDLLYHDMVAGKGDKTGEWFKAIKKVKDDTPKP